MQKERKKGRGDQPIHFNLKRRINDPFDTPYTLIIIYNSLIRLYNTLLL